jgi:hypothetical protein
MPAVGNSSAGAAGQIQSLSSGQEGLTHLNVPLTDWHFSDEEHWLSEVHVSQHSGGGVGSGDGLGDGDGGGEALGDGLGEGDGLACGD